MNKRNLIFIPVATVLFVSAILLLLNHRQTPAWQAKLDQYLAFLKQTGQHSYQVLSVDTAASPANFTPTMSAESYSESVIFETTHTQDTEYTIGLQPMPYPPQQVMCVLLNIDNQPQLVYIALHNSLYNADWIVHISPETWGSLTLKIQLDSIGCSLGA
jgi:hypothetical protein